MSNTYKIATKQSIIEEIDKAFRSVNNICQQYFQSRKNSLGKPESFVEYRNFNNYKQNEKDPTHNQTKNNPKRSIDLIDNDENQSYESPQNQSNNSSSDVEIDQRPIQGKGMQSIMVKPTIFKSHGQKISQSQMMTLIPSPPKPPLSPYFIFYKQKKDLIKQQFPDMSVSQLASAAAKVWKSLTQDEKGPYNRKYFEQKRDYQKKMTEYTLKYPNYKQQLKSGSMKAVKK